ncbi:MAG TPA: hypothetical protein VMP68_10145 [Candidatus Eisenbacteria bacterium]|nr:hypothetical protein [Candidatus Eisenbacteria bacterium]
MFRIEVDEEDGWATKDHGALEGSVCRGGKASGVALRGSTSASGRSEVTFIDNSGEEVLPWLGHIGAQFIAPGLLLPRHLRAASLIPPQRQRIQA